MSAEPAGARFDAEQFIWTLERFLELPEQQGPRLELWDSVLVVTPRPVLRHQVTLMQLALVLGPAMPRELLLAPEVEVRVPAGVLVPDLVVARRGLRLERDRLVPAAGVLLVVEVESPSTRRRDRLMKKHAYAEAGIPQYWRIEWDEADRPSVVTYELRGELYGETARHLPGEVARIERPFPVAFDPADLVS